MFTKDPWRKIFPPPDPGEIRVIDNPTPPLVPPPDENPTGGGGGGGGGTAGVGGTGGGYLGMSSGLRPIINIPNAPNFKGPGFTRPSFEAAWDEPGYQFRLNSGRNALERSAAARGVLRTGGTLKDIMDYGQQFGASEYNNIFNRDLAAYDRQYQVAKDEFAPDLAEWQANAQAEQMAALAGYQREWDQYQFNNLSAGQRAANRPNIGPNIPPPPREPDFSAFGSNYVNPFDEEYQYA